MNKPVKKALVFILLLFFIFPLISQDIDSKKGLDLEDIEENLSQTESGKKNKSFSKTEGSVEGEKIEVKDKYIKGTDESEIESKSESEINVNPDLGKDYVPHRRENPDSIKGKDLDRARGKSKSAYIRAGFGNYHSFLLDIYLAKTDNIGRRAAKQRSRKSSLDMEEKLLKGRRMNLDSEGLPLKYHYFQKQITYLLSYSRRYQSSLSRLDENLKNSASSLDDFSFIAGLAALPKYRQKFSLDYYHKNLALQNNSFYNNNDNKSIKLSLENSYRWTIRRMLSFYAAFSHYDFSYRKQDFNFNKESLDTYNLGGSFKGGLSKNNYLSSEAYIQYNQGKSTVPVSINQGLRQNIVQDNQVIVFAHFRIFDTYTAVNTNNTALGAYRLQFLFGLNADGAAQMSGAAGPYLGIKQALSRVLFWDLIYKHQAVLISPELYIDNDYSLPGWKREPWLEHNIENKITAKFSKSVQLHFDAAYHIASNYPEWEENNRGLYTLTGKDLDYLELSPYFKWKFYRKSSLKFGFKTFLVVNGEIPAYTSDYVPFLKLETEPMGFKTGLKLHYYSSQNTNSGKISDYVLADLSLERKVYASFHLFTEVKNLFNQKVQKRRLYKEEGLKIIGGSRILF